MYSFVKYVGYRLTPPLPPDRYQRGLSAILTQDYNLSHPSQDPSSPGHSIRTIKVHLEHTNGKLPTHIFAAVDTKSNKAQMYPVHGLLYAVNCATPIFPPDSLASPPTPERYLDQGFTLTLPFIAFSMPHLTSFELVNTFLYNRNPYSFIRNLFPPLPNGSFPNAELDRPSIRTRLSYTLATSFSVAVLLETARFMHGVWSNLTALGIVQEEIWSTLDLAWSILLEGISLATQL